ncbi:hypothetical protein AB0I28_12275 [Phytomonospora sp. NPDC050363]|uniref:hypothetical protein n=1 Tax=Phytomonospora sp. NPDC050363 TaxID=3155642 RepID=UPI0033F46126
MTPVELAESQYVAATQETRRAVRSRLQVEIAGAAARQQTTGHAMLILKAEAGLCFFVGCREAVDMEYCDAHLTEVAA